MPLNMQLHPTSCFGTGSLAKLLGFTLGKISSNNWVNKTKSLCICRFTQWFWIKMFIDLPIFKLDYEIRDSHRLEVDTACVIVSNHQSCLDVIGKLSRSFIFYYRPQTYFAKVMFLQVSVCPQGGWYPSMPCRSHDQAAVYKQVHCWCVSVGVEAA